MRNVEFDKAPSAPDDLRKIWWALIMGCVLGYAVMWQVGWAGLSCDLRYVSRWNS